MDRALYGLQESRHSWSLDRDHRLRQLKWKGSKGQECKLAQCESDGCIWKVLSQDGTMHGTLGVYVDDLLFMAHESSLARQRALIFSLAWAAPKSVAVAGMKLASKKSRLQKAFSTREGG